MKGYMYILKCANGQYYTGSTKNLERRLAQHQAGEGANFTRKHLPVKLVYFEESLESKPKVMDEIEIVGRVIQLNIFGMALSHIVLAGEWQN